MGERQNQWQTQRLFTQEPAKNHNCRPHETFQRRRSFTAHLLVITRLLLLSKSNANCVLPRWSERPEWQWVQSRSAAIQKSGGGTAVALRSANHFHRDGRSPPWRHGAGERASSPWWCSAPSHSAPKSRAKETQVPTEEKKPVRNM